MSKVLKAISLTLLLGSTGCSIILKDKGAIGFEYSQRFGFYHEAATTESEASSTTDLQPVVDYVIKLREPEETDSDNTDG